MTPNSAVPEPIAALVEIFAAELPEVVFPGVNATALRTLADAVEHTAAELEQAEQAVNTARRAHAEARAALVASAERGIGYARVYAADDEALSARLAELTLLDKTRGAKAAKPVGQRRSRKAPPKPDTLVAAPHASVAELPFAARKHKAGVA